MKTRRELIAAGALVSAGSAGAFPIDQAVLPSRILGRTGRKVPILGFGLAPLGSDNTPPDEAAEIVSYAISQGVTYLDVAPIYGNDQQKYGNAESKLKPVLAKLRDQVFLVTKVNAQRATSEGVLTQLEESRKRMGVDQIDAVHLHNLGDFDEGMVYSQSGALGGLKEARRRGWLKYIGVSGHSRPGRFIAAFLTHEFDLTMVPINFVDGNNYDFQRLALIEATKRNVGIVAMKVLGGAQEWKYDARTPGCFGAYHAKAIRYSLGVPGVACAVIGMSNKAEVDAAVQAARNWQPLSGKESDELLTAGRRLAEKRQDYFGPKTNRD